MGARRGSGGRLGLLLLLVILAAMLVMAVADTSAATSDADVQDMEPAGFHGKAKGKGKVGHGKHVGWHVKHKRGLHGHDDKDGEDKHQHDDTYAHAKLGHHHKYGKGNHNKYGHGGEHDKYGHDQHDKYGKGKHDHRHHHQKGGGKN